MSRIGKQPITVPAGVEVKIGTDVVEVKGPKGTLHTPVCSLLNYDLTDGVLTLTRVEDDRHSRAQHGLRRTLLANCIEGVTKGFSKSLEVIGVGYRVAVKGNLVELSVGFSHPVLVELPEGIQAKAEGQILTISLHQDIANLHAGVIGRGRNWWAKWPPRSVASASPNPTRARALSIPPRPSAARSVSPAARSR